MNIYIYNKTHTHTQMYKYILHYWNKLDKFKIIEICKQFWLFINIKR